MKELLMLLQSNRDENQGRIMLSLEESQIVFDALITIAALDYMQAEYASANSG